jgi:hypothetical protein
VTGPGRSLLPQDAKVTTLFPLEGMQNALDHLEVLLEALLEVLLWIEMGIINAGRILQLMVLIRIQAMDMLSKSIYFLFSFFT